MVQTMATSGTTSFSVTRNDIIYASLRLIGVLEEGAVPSATAIETASLVLNMLIKDWMTDGIKLWTTNEIVLPLVANQTTYTLGPDYTNSFVTPKPLRLIQAFLRNGPTPEPIITNGAADAALNDNQVDLLAINGNLDPVPTPSITWPDLNQSTTVKTDIPMYILSEQEYNILGSKFSTGQINSVFYKPFVNYGQLKVFLTPNTYIQDNYFLHLTVQRPIEDITAANQTFDFPQEWYQSLRWGLAAELASEYGLTTDRISAIISRSNTYKDRLAAWDVENASTFFKPDSRSYNPKFK